MRGDGRGAVDEGSCVLLRRQADVGSSSCGDRVTSSAQLWVLTTEAIESSIEQDLSDRDFAASAEEQENAVEPQEAGREIDDNLIGQLLASYRVERVLGEGGMGRVYLAIHPLIGRQVAIKVLLPEVSANAAMVERFFNEARATTSLRHPGIVDVLDFGHHASGSAFLTMEFLGSCPAYGAGPAA